MPDPSAEKEVEETPDAGDTADKVTANAPPPVVVQVDSLPRYFLPGEDGPLPKELRWV